MGCCNYKIIEKVDNSVVNDIVGTACFGSIKSMFSTNRNLVIWQDKRLIPFTEEEVIKYIEELSKMEFFKVTLDTSDEKIYTFTLDCMEYDNSAFWLGTLTIIRYLWGDKGYSTNIYPLIENFLKLGDKYPEMDVLYKLILAHYSLPALHEGNYGWYGSHGLIDYISTFNFYPFEYKDLVLSQFGSVHGTFTTRVIREYNKTIEEYKAILIEL